MLAAYSLTRKHQLACPACLLPIVIRCPELLGAASPRRHLTYNGAVECPGSIFIISDLHLGGEYGSHGERGFRLNTHVPELVDFLREVQSYAAAHAGGTELVINGDFVDFLAERDEEGQCYAFTEDEDAAVRTFERIAGRDAAVFDQLASMLQSGIALTLTLGNHDLELSLPAVRSRLRECLNAGRAAPFHFIYDGEAYIVGDVLIEHGNRYDGWNVVDFDRLRRQRSEYSRRLDLSEDARFEAPAGSQLVHEVMNPIKTEYGFIDLLKPETDAAIPLLLALEPAYAKHIDRLERVHQLQKDARQRTPREAVRPGRPENISRTASRTRHSSLADLLERRLGPQAARPFLELAAEAEQQSQAEEQRIARGSVGRALSFARMLFTAGGEARLPWLLDAFRQLQNRKLFDWSEETEKEYSDAARELASRGFSTVAFGHTHLAKDMPLPHGSRYLNTGGWTDLIRVPDEIISGPHEQTMQHLKEFAQALGSNRFHKYLAFLPTFGYIRLSAGKVTSATVKQYEKGIVAAL